MHRFSCNHWQRRSRVSVPRTEEIFNVNCSAFCRIDLTAACRVHLIEPQWNPMAEEQALDRVHRIGQTRPVTAIRYIVKGSVEEVSCWNYPRVR